MLALMMTYARSLPVMVTIKKKRMYTMNQQEYELIASTIAITYRAKHYSPVQQRGIKALALDLAYRLQIYPSFDRAKFIKACNIEGLK